MHWFVKLLVVLGVLMLASIFCVIIIGIRIHQIDKRELNMTVGDRMRECDNDMLALAIAKMIEQIDPTRNWIDDKHKIKRQLDEKYYQ